MKYRLRVIGISYHNQPSLVLDKIALYNLGFWPSRRRNDYTPSGVEASTILKQNQGQAGYFLLSLISLHL